MNEASLHLGAVALELALAGITAALLLGVVAPYGRHSRGGWGPTLPARVGWVVMESPAVLLWLWIYSRGAHAAEVVPLVLLGLWQIHYVHRTFLFPFRMRASGKRMPVVITVLAVAFNTLNAYVNARWVSHLGSYDAAWLVDPRFLVGVGIFLVGLAINLHSDTVLLNLRAPGETGYKIPRGGLFRWVSCPNYLGEMIEWIGWAVATWSLAGLAFAAYTAANTGPRAFQHHRWYREQFADYPPERKALIPFVA